MTRSNPSETAWSYVREAGIAANGSDLTNRNPDAPEGTQVAFIGNVGVMSQVWSAAAGTYTLSFQAAQSGSNNMDQQLRVTLRPAANAVTTKTFLWCGNQLCEERDSTGAAVKKRFFAEGEQRIGGSDAGNYYYTRDHLGSIRELTDSTGLLKGRYDYDVWGNSSVVSGNMSVDFGYTGHYYHAPSGLNLALYRAYSPTLGRWLSRDPIGEAGGLNLYGYVLNNPVNYWDPLGLIEDSATQSLMQAIARGSSEEIQLMLETQPQLTPQAQALGRAAVDKLRTNAGDWIAKNCRGCYQP